MECKSLIFRTTIASILLLGSYLPDVLADPAVKGHWSYYPSASIEVEIDAEIILIETVSNSADWTGPISGGYLYVTVIPEPSSVLHMILGTGGILFYRRAKHRQQEQYINHRSYKWQKDHG